jgi:hypothetical protein
VLAERSVFNSKEAIMPALTLAQVTPQPVEWLWPACLAPGKLTMLEGDPNLGKSWIALDLCARLSAGRAWPDGAPSAGAAHALYFSAEDNDADTLAPRLHALGADPERMHIWPSRQPLPQLPSQLTDFSALLADTDVRLAVLDPLPAFLDAGAAVNNERARRLLIDLANVAQNRRCAILLVRHLVKLRYLPALARGAGAMTFSGACRLTMLAARDPDDPSRCLLASLKNNLAPAPPTLAYALAPAAGGGARLAWLGTSPWRPDAAAPRRCDGRARRRATARRWLEKFLKNGPRLSRDIKRLAGRRGLCRNTLYRARRDSAVRIERVPCRGEVLVFWLLKDQQLPEFLRKSR